VTASGEALDVAANAGLRAERSGPVVTITLNRPERRNAQTPDTWSALLQLRSQLPATTRVVVVRGVGTAFSAGIDTAAFSPSHDGTPSTLAALAALPPDTAHGQIASFQRAFGWLSDPSIVSVAAVQGHAIGAGFQLALACDLRLLASDAQFTMAETGLGLVPDLGGTKRLVELVGYSRAAEICLTGRRVPADEAYRIGLASAVAPLDELAALVERTIAALLRSPRDAVIETKALLLAATGRSQTDQERAEREAQYRRLRDLSGLVGED
jgi:enoyl-CoA hydratase/carnithine racemase